MQENGQCYPEEMQYILYRLFRKFITSESLQKEKKSQDKVYNHFITI